MAVETHGCLMKSSVFIFSIGKSLDTPTSNQGNASIRIFGSEMREEPTSEMVANFKASSKHGDNLSVLFLILA